MELWQFQLIRIIPLLAVFAYAAFRDYKFGEVSNKVWLYAPIGLALTLLELYLFTPALSTFTLSVMVVMVAFSFGLFFFANGLCGGADSKALITLSLSLPLSPIFSVYLGIYPLIAFVLAALLVALKFIATKGKGGIKVKVRFLPYLFIGMLIALV